jgi:hypothetical protein
VGTVPVRRVVGRVAVDPLVPEELVHAGEQVGQRHLRVGRQDREQELVLLVEVRPEQHRQRRPGGRRTDRVGGRVELIDQPRQHLVLGEHAAHEQPCVLAAARGRVHGLLLGARVREQLAPAPAHQLEASAVGRIVGA